MRRLLAGIAVALIAASGCGNGAPEQEREAQPSPGEAGGAGRELNFGRLDTIATGLEVPWAIAFADDDTMLVTERPGRVRVVDNGRLREEPALELEVGGGEGGLLGIALHPDFPKSRFAYLYYTAGDGNRVSRFDVSDDLRLDGEERIIDGIPGGLNHDGGRIAFGPDELLYIGTGDAGRSEVAADRKSLGGKILRVRADGSPADDNPFDGSPVYSYGHRNVQGLAWDADGRLYASEHGPTGEGGLCCHDEINLVDSGSFYGWPFRAGRSEVRSGEPPSDPVDPVAESGNETWAPAGVAVHEGEDGRSLLMAGLGGAALFRFAVDGEREVGDADAVLKGEGRLREAIFGPDGCLYLTTSNRDGRGSPSSDDDRVLRSCPSI